jgi:hypothetical protein
MTDQPATPNDPQDRPEQAPSGDGRRTPQRTRAILAGAATALALGGGLTGFLIGHSTADDDARFRPAGFHQGPPDRPGNQPPGFDLSRSPGGSGNPAG